MSPKVKALWVKALRSGEYKQANGNLHTDKGFCCLGVLCDLAVKAKIMSDPIVHENFSSITNQDVYEYDGDKGYLPLAVQRWAEIHTENPRIETEPNVYRQLAALNDEGVPFIKIADLIEESL